MCTEIKDLFKFKTNVNTSYTHHTIYLCNV